jgi:hypothetical protein
LRDIEKLIGQKIPVVKENPFPLTAEETTAKTNDEEKSAHRPNNQPRTGKNKGNYFAQKKQKHWRKS